METDNMNDTTTRVDLPAALAERLSDWESYRECHGDTWQANEMAVEILQALRSAVGES